MTERHTRSADEIRRDVEDQWFALHEAELIAAARKRREAAKKSGASKAQTHPHWKKCPACGGEMKTQTLEGVDADKCVSCEGIFFDAGHLEQLLVSHDQHRRTFFRWLLGFDKADARQWTI